MSILDTFLGRKPDPWRYAPAWALALRNQNIQIINLLTATHLSPADQDKLNRAYDAAVGISDKEAAATQPGDKHG